MVLFADSRGNEVAVKTATQTQNLKDECNALQRFSHPNVVKCFGMVENSLVLEFSSLGSTQSLHLQPHDAMKAALQICKALSFMHSEGWIHGDVKPENILRFSENIFKLADFGTARPISLAGGRLVGTPCYRAPEVFLGQICPKSDVFSLGVSILEWIYQQSPALQQGGTSISLPGEIDGRTIFVRGAIFSNLEKRFSSEKFSEHLESKLN